MGKRLSGILGVGLVALLVAVAGLAGASPGSEASGFAPGLWASPLSIDFGTAAVGEMAGPVAVTFTNSGTTFISPFDVGGLPAPFLRSHTCDSGLFAGATCQVAFTFAPETAGSFAATAVVTTEIGAFNIALRGASVGPVLHVSPLALDFGSVRAGESGQSQFATITNVGRAHLDFTGITAPSAPFQVTPNCAGGLAPNASCPVTFNFMPASAGNFADVVEIESTGGAASVQLMGSGRDEVFGSGQRVTPRNLDFGPVPVGTNSAPLLVRITNESTTEHLLDWEQTALAAPFAMATNCQDDIDPATFCDYTYTFSPTDAGEFTATHTITNNRGTFPIALRGTGVEPEITAHQVVLEFGPVPPGAISPVQAVTIRNTGVVTLPTLFGGAPIDQVFGASTTCGAPLAPGGTCTVFYTFEPDAPGRHVTQSTFSLDSSGKRRFTIELRGGVAAPALAAEFQPAAVDPGEVATLHVEISNPNATITLADIQLSAALSAGLVVADPPLPSVGPGCNGAFQPVAGASAVAFSGNVAGGETCALSVKVVAAADGAYTADVTAASDSGPASPAQAALTVGEVAVNHELFLPFVIR